MIESSSASASRPVPRRRQPRRSVRCHSCCGMPPWRRAARWAKTCGAAEPSDLIVDGIHWLSGRQNKDGGWGNVEAGQSNTGTTTLVQAALHLTAVPARHADLLAGRRVRSQARGRRGGSPPVCRRQELRGGGPDELRSGRHGSLREVPALPFEVTCLPPWYRQLRRIPDVNHDLPVLIAVGQARFFHRRRSIRSCVGSAAPA